VQGWFKPALAIRFRSEGKRLKAKVIVWCRGTFSLQLLCWRWMLSVGCSVLDVFPLQPWAFHAGPVQPGQGEAYSKTGPVCAKRFWTDLGGGRIYWISIDNPKKHLS